MKFNKEMSMGEILQLNPNARAVLEGFGMHCCGCPVSQAEALEDACDVHGVDVELVLDELNNLDDVEHDGCACGCGCFGEDDEDYDDEDFEYEECDCCDGDDPECDCDCHEDFDDECDCEDECDDDCDCGCKD